MFHVNKVVLVLHRQMPNLLQGLGTEFRSEKIVQGQVRSKYNTKEKIVLPVAEFLDEIQTKVLRVFLLAIHSYLP